ncbi:MAG TPA: carboxypeptidase regulatory-like domain-containing protein [Gemmatimonadaceae bacterium]|nr:carboxypeptidase regulatory-like domain-containing protein [Gemmatimonadaceae bacterium]
MTASVALTVLAAGPASGQAVRITGRVIDAARSTPVAGATVRISGQEPVSTGTTGAFTFEGVLPGRRILTVTSLGYALHTATIQVGGDTSITISLEPRAVSLDTMIVRPGRIRVKGTAVDSATGDYLMQAQAILYPGGKTVGATSGVFVFDSVAPGPVTIVVEAMEHLPTSVRIDARRDTTILVHLGIDSIALRMIAFQVKRLETRTRAVAMPADALNRDAILRQGSTSVGEVIKRRLYEDAVEVRMSGSNLRPPDAGCFFLDDLKVSRDVYEGVLPEMIERIEIYREAGLPPAWSRTPASRNFGGVRMVRVYTKRYVATLSRQETLPPVFHAPGIRVACG